MFRSLTLAVVVLCALPFAVAVAAGPGRHDGCSGSVCVRIHASADGLGEPSGRVAIGYSFTVDHPLAAGAVLTLHHDPGLAADPNSIDLGGTKAVITTSGNDVVITTTDVQDGIGYLTYYAFARPGLRGRLHGWASLRFTAAGGGPSATASSNDFVVSAGPDLRVSRVYAPHRLPHGATSVVTAELDSRGTELVPAGAAVRVRLTGGARLGAGGVKFGQGRRNRLSCTGSGPVWTCPLPVVAAANEASLNVAVRIPRRIPAGRRVAIRVRIPPAAIGDVNPSDNSLEHDARVGRVA